MRDETRAHLDDIVRAAHAVKQFVTGRRFEDDASDAMLRSAVERKFEALNRIRRDEPALLQQIRYHRDIISFRNILVHGYDAIDDRIVWGIIQDDVDDLVEDVGRLPGAA
jgi:uncharacterized protein with HEPN domain